MKVKVIIVELINLLTYSIVQSLSDILQLFPDQSFEFVEFNVNSQEVISIENDVLDCVKVCLFRRRTKRRNNRHEMINS